MKPMDFFVWQDGGGVNSPAIDDDPNAARRKKTRFHGTLWIGIGITHLGAAIDDAKAERNSANPGSACAIPFQRGESGCALLRHATGGVDTSYSPQHQAKFQECIC
jgi:hypothetical protein